ncbi:hypothetical protein D3C87_947480 [compost metagenome]|jgi:hypothetical protein
MNKRLVALLASSSVFVASGAMAQVTAYAVGQGTPNNITLGVPVTASVGGACNFTPGASPNATYNFPNADLGFSQDTAFSLTCNGPSRVAIVSQEGGLKSSVAAPAGYTALLPYQVELNMVGTGGATASASCDANLLTAAAANTCVFRGPVSFTQGLKLNAPSTGQTGSYVRIVAPPYGGAARPVAASDYADTLKVTLSAAL